MYKIIPLPLKKLKKLSILSRIIKYLKKIYSMIGKWFPWNIKAFLQMKYFFSKIFNKNDLCFDIGANRGNYTLNLLLNRVKVVCVEPQNHCLKLLYNRYRHNKKVNIVGKAVGSDISLGKIWICRNNDNISTLSQKWMNEGRFSKIAKWDEIQDVEIITLDSLINTFGLPKFCKIDVEGWELEVFKGLSKIIPYISFEYSKEFLDDAEGCMNYLMSLGSPKFNFTIEKIYTFYFSEWKSKEKLIAKLRSIKNDRLWGDIYVKFPSNK